MEDTLCLIPAKGCSTRLPRKNLLPMGGKPLLAHTITKAFEVDMFDTICVSTEDKEIANIAQKCGADVPFIRPESLARDPATIVDVMLHALDFYQNQGKTFKKSCVLLPTAPFVTRDDIQSAIRMFDEWNEEALMSVTKTEYPPFNAWIVKKKENHEVLTACFPKSPYKYMKSTECPETYRSNGAILIVNVETFQANKGYHDNDIVPFIMPNERSLDIDTELEYKFATFLYERELV